MDELGRDELIRQVEKNLSHEARKIFNEALEANDFNALLALAGVCEAYVAGQRDISFGYLRR